jgi:hypothetical protein
MGDDTLERIWSRIVDRYTDGDGCDGCGPTVSPGRPDPDGTEVEPDGTEVEPDGTEVEPDRV